MGDGVAGRSKAKEMLSRELMCGGFEMQCPATAKLCPARRSDGIAWQAYAMHSDGVATKCEGFALLSFAMRRQSAALERDGVAKP